jgi:hypothetical protein
VPRPEPQFERTFPRNVDKTGELPCALNLEMCARDRLFTVAARQMPIKLVVLLLADLRLRTLARLTVSNAVVACSPDPFVTRS